MCFKKWMLLTILAGTAAGAFGQTVPLQKAELEKNQAAAWEVPVSYDLFRANIPPGRSECFWMNGIGTGLVANAKHGISFVADLTLVQAGNINNTSQNLTVFNYQFGPRYSLRTHSRLTPYAQALVGGSHISSNYVFYSPGINSFASTLGGGVQVRVSHHFAITPGEADWVFSNAGNGVRDTQNNLRITAGFVLLFGSRKG